MEKSLEKAIKNWVYASHDSKLIDEVWATPGAVKPDPYLSTYDWASGL